MIRRATCFLFCAVAFGQALPEDPLLGKLIAIQRARSTGRSDEAVVLREEARRMLDVLPSTAPEFAGLAQGVAQLYGGGGRKAQARGILQAALDRVGRDATTVPVRTQLLTAIADSWQDDHNLPKAVEYLEKAIAAESESKETPAIVGFTTSLSELQMHGTVLVMSGGRAARYQRLADLLRQLGRADEATLVRARLRELAAKAGARELARYLEFEGKLDEAAEVYRQAAESAATSQDAVELLQRLAGVYARDDRLDRAIAAQRRVIERMEGSGTRELREQSTDARETLARMLREAGQTGPADAIYEELIAGGAGQELPLLASYANYLADSGRAAQAIERLKSFQSRHSALEAEEERILIDALANSARTLGDVEQTAKYEVLQRARRQEAMQDFSPELEVSGFEDLFREAQASSAKPVEAFALAMRALDAAARAGGSDQIGTDLPSIATALAANGGAQAAEQLYQRALSLAESWSPYSVVALLQLSAGRVQFLTGSTERHGEARSEIDRYRDLLIAANGAGTGTLEQPLRMLIQLENTRTGPVSVIPAQDLAAFEEALNGSTSEPYLEALKTLADAYERNQDWEHATAVRLRVVQIGDLVYTVDDVQRGQTRVDAAMALANQGRFDEAEALALEGIAAGKGVRRTPGVSFEGSLQQIRQMRAARGGK